MKRSDKARLGLNGLPATDLVERGRSHVERCSGNPDLILPPDFLALMAAACDALEYANMAVR